MKLLIGIPIIILALAAAVVMVVFYMMLRVWLRVRKYMRGDFTDEEVERLSKKYHRQENKHNFSQDYFKRSESRSRSSQQQTGNDFRQYRTTRTSEGVTIIDDRDPNQATRKIFDDGEGEYVDFQEES
ncbi:MAG: DUF4834 family protein [Prevotella sp.]|nr:DUF4834 family protein [Prevotella sp.]